MVEANTAIPPEMQTAHAELHGIALGEGGIPHGADGQPLSDFSLQNMPRGMKVDYDALPEKLTSSISTLAAVGDHDLPPTTDPASPEAQEYVAARDALIALEAQSADYSQPTPSQNDLAAAHARYLKADVWLQWEKAKHRQSVQVAHGVPIGPAGMIIFADSTAQTA